MATSGVPFFTKNAIERVCVFTSQCKRKGVCLCRQCITQRQFLKFLVLRSNFQQFFFQKRVYFGKICKENSMFFTKKFARERVSFSKILQEKGYSFGYRVGTPHTKIRQVPPLGYGYDKSVYCKST